MVQEGTKYICKTQIFDLCEGLDAAQAPESKQD